MKICVCSILCFFFFFEDTSSANSFLGRYDVIIDVGHGGVDPGTFYGTTFEKEINLAVGKYLYAMLQKEKLLVGITRLNDYALSDDSTSKHVKSRHKRDLMQRKLIADLTSTSVFISLHVNWSNHPHNQGPFVIYQPGNQSLTLAQLVQHHLNHVLQSNHAPVKGKSYYLMKKIQNPAIIVEMGFLSNKRDMGILTSPHYQKQIAKSIAEAITEYFTLYPI